MKTAHELFAANEERLMESALAYAKEHGYARYTSALLEAWRVSIQGVTQALGQAEEECGLTGRPIVCDDGFVDDAVSQFAAAEAGRHRERGVSLSMFLRLLKYYRRAYVDLVEAEVVEVEARRAFRDFVMGCFDRMEIALSADWAAVDDAEHVSALERSARQTTNEKNRLLTLLESIATPVFLMDPERRVEFINQAAAEHLGLDEESGGLHYARFDEAETDQPDEGKLSLADVAPWLVDAMAFACTPETETFDCRFDVEAETALGLRHFTASISDMSDISETFRGYAMVLEDVTLRVEMERQMERERNRAEHYLDIVGALVVGLDASGSITMINDTGCRLLGYDRDELLGRNWIDVVVPEEQRDEARDYLYFIFNQGGDALEDDELHQVNYVTTKSGEHLLLSWSNRIIRSGAEVPIGVLSCGVDVTEQRRAEEALAEKELWLRNTFVALKEAVFILSPERRIIDANPAAEIMFEMTNEEMLDLPARRLHVDDEHYERFKRLVGEAVAQGKDASLEYLMRRSSGEAFPTEHSVALITGDDGTTLGSVSVLRDISRRKEAEQILRRSEEKFRRIFESIEEGYIVTDMDGVINLVNPATCRLLGYSETELVGQDFRRIYSDEQERAQLKASLAEKGWVRGKHLTVQRKDGSTIVVEANAHRVKDDDGAHVGMEGTFRDITERIEAEKVLREREKQYRAFFENNHAIMLLVAPQTGEMVDANPAAAEFYGYPVERMRTMPAAQINAQSEKEIFREMFRARQEKRSYFLLKHRLATGEVRDVEVYSGPIMVRGNQLLYSVIHDVTERVRLSAEMERLATTDSLTGAANRHQFFTLAEQEFGRAQRYEHPLAVLMLDIDYFKSINDTHGHHAGDVALKALSSLAVATLRDPDVFGRLGGEEFAAVLPETDLNGAVQVAERLREALAKLDVEVVSKGVTIHFTVSIGVAETRPGDQLVEDVINRADEALYKAKRMGRNRVEKS